VTGLSNRYREGRLSLNEIQKEIERMNEKTEKAVRESLLSQWIDALSLKDEDERLLKGIELLKHRSADQLKEKHRQLLSQYRREEEKVKEKVRAQLTEALKREGIYGSAVEFNIEASSLWKKEGENLDHLYSSKLEEIKEALRSL
jgi:sigma54-dependent transcription regulator